MRNALSIYLVVGNHNSARGIVETTKILLTAFSHIDAIDICIVETVVPGKVNIIIEETNEYLAEQLVSIKEQYPQTTYILYVTEYLIKRFGKWQFNSFTLFEAAFQYLVSTLQSLKLLSHSHPGVCTRALGIFLPHDFLSKHVMLSRRSNLLVATAHLYSLCISTTEQVLTNYGSLCNCSVALVPILIDTDLFYDKIFKRICSRNYTIGVGISGRLSPYRKKLLASLGRLSRYRKKLLASPCHGSILAYPMTLDHNEGFNYLLKQLDGTVDDMQPILLTTPTYYNSMHDMINTFSPPLFELYIPQSSEWPYSSPNRTYLSIQNGFLPINMGTFNDHPINHICYEFTTKDQLDSILLEIRVRGIIPGLNNFLSSLSNYNRLELEKIVTLSSCLLGSIHSA